MIKMNFQLTLNTKRLEAVTCVLLFTNISFIGIVSVIIIISNRFTLETKVGLCTRSPISIFTICADSVICQLLTMANYIIRPGDMFALKRNWVIQEYSQRGPNREILYKTQVTEAVDIYGQKGPKTLQQSNRIAMSRNLSFDVQGGFIIVDKMYISNLCEDKDQVNIHPYVLFVIFLHRQNFWRMKFTPKTANFLPISAH